MARIAGVNIPTAKRVVIALTYIHGIGNTKAKEICEKVGIMPERRVNELSDAEVIKIRETIDGDYTVEGDLRREIAMNIKRLLDLGVYRGLRHRRFEDCWHHVDEMCHATNQCPFTFNTLRPVGNH